ncbi:hydantoinase/oxoprolinase family protein [Mesorhizobium sp. CA18]|uniref:hydantoinase/oxoprolinase family protein n=1 Tax=unclassified Mesorhizobium TaxID=325217 RepID=UPI001CCDC020|nr:MULTISPECIES: hydantoinase/oxoprolinase family protein [unclassified Mesorhizobium]MBZ9736335.1 hydantoinase/oxoprolinase family protein [Mesorhizobium sp. CA9]MBZ9829338.1 hydantoinase/oxoprolinase family protein [Mesorhizobium sp. CA18]MBZ9833870.1 hydantoinase/oxoprolinase family protein [Mesorhizobium sp. CA2]MBZ9840023.1 hydantoinase/oxoprolinase family protein [Mesorhizobium sp. CA3]MBZ9880202.1 hydantoinase/oxoprolinase family protein [Mesorhizobium sp. Ca11]
MTAKPPPLFLGIDTGGTYTDAVLWSEEGSPKGKVLAKAKSLTTRHDLAVGISGAVDAVLEQSRTDPASIKLISMSTTLATNALVESQGGRVALVMIGFSEADLARDGLKTALGTDPVVFCPGGHDVHGNAAKLDLSGLDAALPELGRSVSGFAVCAYFATRNPAHELSARNLIRDITGLPVTASHELSAKLGGPRRALTTLLNARLISMIDRLVAATEGFLGQRGIAAPLMVVRGDGALVSAAFARQRPIETILSGPAASLVGARHMTGLDDAMVSDIGGTTTDVAVLDGGRPRLDPEGATVGGFRTMVEAVAMRTFGLGGDSEVTLEDGALDPKILLGPRRLVPLALSGMVHGEAVTTELERQLRAPNPGRMDGRFALRTGVPDRLAAGLTGPEAKLYEAIGATPLALDRLLASNAQNATLNRLVARGLVHISGFTPSDAAHVLGKQANWHAATARLGAELFARRRDGRGQTIAATPEEISQRVLVTLTRWSAEYILETAFAEDGLDGAATVAHALVQRAVDAHPGIARFTVALDRPVIGLGASAPLHYAGLPPLVGNGCIVPEDTDVANALGAVVGQVRVSAEARVSQPKEGLFRLASGQTVRDFTEEDKAIEAAQADVRALAADRAKDAGTDSAEINVSTEFKVSTIEGQRMFIEAHVVAVASGRPRIAV